MGSVRTKTFLLALHSCVAALSVSPTSTVATCRMLRHCNTITIPGQAGTQHCSTIE